MADFSDLGGVRIKNKKEDFSDLGGVRLSAAPKDQSTLERLANSMPVRGLNAIGEGIQNVGIGGVDEAHNELANIANLWISPKNQIDPWKHSEGTMYETGKLGLGMLGMTKGAGAISEALLPYLSSALKNAPKVLPLGEKIAKMLSSSGFARGAANTAGMGTYGAIQDPENRLRGAAWGAGTQGVGELVSPIAKGVSKITENVKPQELADKIVKSLGGGKTLEENAKSLSQDLRNAYLKNRGDSDALYDRSVGLFRNNLLDGVRGSTREQAGQETRLAYNNLNKDIIKKYDLDLKDLHDKFLENPTFQNAHNLKSQLLTEGRKLKNLDDKGMLETPERIVKQSYERATDALRSDINSFLLRKDPEAAKAYEEATENFKENVAPYLANPRIARIVKDAKKKPLNISNIFKNPSQDDDLAKIVSDLSEASHRKILYSEFAKPENSSPESMNKLFIDLDKKGLNSYITPDLRKNINLLNSRIGKRDFFQKASGALGGVLAAKTLGASSVIPEISGGILGALAAKRVAGMGSKSSSGLEPAGHVGKTAITGIAKAIQAALLNRNNQSRPKMKLSIKGEEDSE